MYGGPNVDPTHGRAKWHRLDVSKWKAQEKPVLGQLNPKEYDEKHGRWWFTRKEEERPKLYTTIGRHARSKKLKRTIVRFAYASKNFKRLKKDPYRKRWPKNDQVCVRFFAEFCLKDFEKRTMAETAHTLPLYGVGCKLWRGSTPETPDTKGQFFVASSADYRLRPIRGMLRGTEHLAGRPVRVGVAAVGKSLGSWCYELPQGGHPAVYRPPFPKMLSGQDAPPEAADAE